jgi:hypothetical protein
MDQEKKLKWLRIGNISTLILTIVVNFLSTLLPLNGVTPGDISDAIPNLFVPSGLTFSIWSVIYVLLIIFIIFQSKGIFKSDEEGNKFIEKIGIFFILSNIANTSWIFLWHYGYVGFIWGSLIAMIGILGSLLTIYIRLKIGMDESVSLKNKFIYHVPFSVYLGWITVATIANITAVAVTYGWDGFGISEPLWAMIMIIIALVLTLVIQLTRKDIAYSLVIVWAILGIYLKRTAPAVTPEPLVAYTALASVIVLLIGVVWLVYKKNKK